MKPYPISPLCLTHGQFLWTLCQGVPPQGPRRRLLLDQLRYLRQLDVPFAEQRRGQGRGRAIQYSYEEVVEMAVALFALRRGVRPSLVADYLVTNRTALRRIFRRALEEQSATAPQASWLKRRGKHKAIPANESFLRLHNRMRNASGSYERVQPWKASAVVDVCRQGELFPDGPADTIIPLTRLVLEVIYWARQAPEIRPGRKGQGAHSPHPSSMGARMSEGPQISPDAYLAEEILCTVAPRKKRHGRRTGTRKARDQTVRQIEDQSSPRKGPGTDPHSA